MARKVRQAQDIVERALISLLSPQRATDCPVDYVDEMTTRKTRFRRRPRRNRPVDAVMQPRPAQLVVLERVSSTTVTIFWSDARSGHYADQLWRLGQARRDAYCVLTGRPIYRGDAVYRPRKCDHAVPGNWDRMIHAREMVSRDAEAPTASLAFARGDNHAHGSSEN